MAENSKHPSSGFAGSSRLASRFSVARWLSELSGLTRYLILFVGLMIISGSTGCQSGKWGNRDSIFPKPNLGKMAFWKKENTMPSPPAMHFQPASAGEQQLAANEPNQSNQPFRNTEQELKQSMDAMAAVTEDGFDRATEELATMADNLRNQPARSPFTLSSDKEIESRSNQSEFAGSRNFTPSQKSNPINSLAAAAAFNPTNAGSQRSKDEFSAAPASSVANQPADNSEKARQDFLTAMNNTTTTWNNAAVASKENLDSLKNNLRAEFQPQQKLEQVNSVVNQQVAQAQTRANQFLAPIEDAASQTRHNLSNASQQFQQDLNGFGQQVQNQVANQQQQLNQDFAHAQQEIQQFRNQLATTKQQMLAPLAPANHSPLAQNANQAENHSNVTLNANPAGQPASSSRTIASIGPLNGSWPNGDFQPSGNAEMTSPSNVSNGANRLGQQSSQYPSTGFSEFKPGIPAGNLSPLSPAGETSGAIRMAGLDQASRNSSQFSNAPGTDSAKNSFPASSKSNEGLDVVIPDAILNSRGGYTPGSLNRIHLR